MLTAKYRHKLSSPATQLLYLLFSYVQCEAPYKYVSNTHKVQLHELNFELVVPRKSYHALLCMEFYSGGTIECMTCIIDQTLPSKLPLQTVAVQVEDMNVI